MKTVVFDDKRWNITRNNGVDCDLVRSNSDGSVEKRSAVPFYQFPKRVRNRLRKGKNVTEMKTVKVLTTGQEIQIPVDTSACCDPSTELYWSM